MDIRAASLALHYRLQGKLEMVSRCPIQTQEDLSLAYTPGVAAPCLEIQKDPALSFQLTRRRNLVAVITDGSAVLGLGDIGPLAGMPVMEGKCVLFKEFAGVDAVPLCVDTQDVEEMVQTIALISKSFGGINLEDIAAPRCFEVERRLKERCDIPVFHDDQHGTAVVITAALTNALKVVGKKKEQVKVVLNGIGAAGGVDVHGHGDLQHPAVDLPLRSRVRVVDSAEVSPQAHGLPGGLGHANDCHRTGVASLRLGAEAAQGRQPRPLQGREDGLLDLIESRHGAASRLHSKVPHQWDRASPIRMGSAERTAKSCPCHCTVSPTARGPCPR